MVSVRLLILGCQGLGAAHHAGLFDGVMVCYVNVSFVFNHPPTPPHLLHSHSTLILPLHYPLSHPPVHPHLHPTLPSLPPFTHQPTQLFTPPSPTSPKLYK
ncbi:hypothetical protein V8C86DRAFT_2506449, partial [Haematococcus lacustris]